MPNKFFILFIVSITLLTSCASSYRSIYPESISFSNSQVTDGIIFSYRNDILHESGNKKYYRKEDNKGLNIISVKITKTTDSIIEYNIGLFLGPGLAIGNATLASSANKDLGHELNKYNLLYRPIQPNETAYGIVAFRSEPYIPISLKTE